MTEHLLQQFIDEHTYDIRVSRNGRWIDQKCTLDEVSFVADCIVDYLSEGGEEPFHSPDIWRSDYAIRNVQSVFSKPDPRTKTAIDEFNKFFRQPMKMLAAAGVLSEHTTGSTIEFRVQNKDVLEFIALRERNAFVFLCQYIEKTLKDSGLWDAFNSFFDEQTQDRFDEVKNSFANFCICYTPINTKVEAGRIFAKVINPLACQRHKRGTLRGRMSTSMITYDKIMYNQANWRDISSGKEKNIARRDFTAIPRNEAVYTYEIERAKRNLRRFNDRYRNSRSEIVDNLSIGQIATHMHHIFPQGQFPGIADYIENIIALTSGQHLQRAHPNGNTSVVDRDYQYMCLLAKTENIRANLEGEDGTPIIYNFNDFMHVLDVGFSIDYFEALNDNDFMAVVTGIEFNHANNLV